MAATVTLSSRLLAAVSVFCAALAVSGAGPAPVATASPAEALFARAVKAAQIESHPEYATYTVVVTVDVDGRRVVRSWQTTEDGRHAIVLARSFANEESANPFTPHGIDLRAHRRIALSSSRSLDPQAGAASGLMLNSHPLNPADSGDLVGPVALAVDQNYGLTPPRVYRAVRDEQSIAAGADELTVIGRTGTQRPRYAVHWLDTSNGIAHLALTALRDPYHNRLREVWLDTATATLREAIVAGVGDRAPFDRVGWHITFAGTPGATFVSRARTVEPLALAGRPCTVTIAFEQLTVLDHMPFTATFGIEAPVRALRDP